jgi:hypothetical protein
MNNYPDIRPTVIASYEDNGERHLLPISERELARSEAFMRRVLAPDRLKRGRFALITATLFDATHTISLERALMTMGLIICSAEASPYDGGRILSICRCFDVAIIAAVTPVVLGAIRAAAGDPLEVFKGKIVWANREAYDELKGAEGIDLRLWIVLGPAVAVETKYGDGLHVDGREWKVEPKGDVTYLTSRLDRAQGFDRLPIHKSVKLNKEACPSGNYGPRIMV